MKLPTKKYARVFRSSTGSIVVSWLSRSTRDINWKSEVSFLMRPFSLVSQYFSALSISIEKKTIRRHICKSNWIRNPLGMRKMRVLYQYLCSLNDDPLEYYCVCFIESWKMDKNSLFNFYLQKVHVIKKLCIPIMLFSNWILKILITIMLLVIFSLWNHKYFFKCWNHNWIWIKIDDFFFLFELLKIWLLNTIEKLNDSTKLNVYW